VVILSDGNVPNVPNVPDEYAADRNLPLGHSVHVNNIGLVNGRLRHKKATTGGTNHITAFSLNARLPQLKNKIQLDATHYFIMLMLSSTCFVHRYAHHQELTTMSLVTTEAVWFSSWL